jgi:hypothetical protein
LTFFITWWVNFSIYKSPSHYLCDFQMPLLKSPEDQVARETLWILSNIAAGTNEQVSRLFAVKGFAETIIGLCGDENPRKRKVSFSLSIMSEANII